MQESLVKSTWESPRESPLVQPVQSIVTSPTPPTSSTPILQVHHKNTSPPPISFSTKIIQVSHTQEGSGFRGLSSCVPKSKLIPPNKSKGEQYFKLHSTCPYFYSYGRRPEYSKRNKCTNYLARCKATGCQADVWKYDMKEHYKQCHPLLTLPEVFSISNEEKDTIHLFESK